MRRRKRERKQKTSLRGRTRFLRITTLQNVDSRIERTKQDFDRSIDRSRYDNWCGRSIESRVHSISMIIGASRKNNFRQDLFLRSAKNVLLRKLSIYLRTPFHLRVNVRIFSFRSSTFLSLSLSHYHFHSHSFSHLFIFILSFSHSKPTTVTWRIKRIAATWTSKPAYRRRLRTHVHFYQFSFEAIERKNKK